MRALAWFWAIVILLAGAGAGYLQWRGPPPSSVVTASTDHVAAVAPAAAMMAIGGPIVAPDRTLLEPSKVFSGGFLPRIGPDRRGPSRVYAAPSDPFEVRPMVAILLAGIGMSVADSDQAILATPPAISLAVSPYTVVPDALLAEARQHGHEYFLSIPMEPRGYPLNDPGNRALLTGNTPAVNQEQLEWAMTRFTGYAGATGAMGDLHGERFADNVSQMEPVLEVFEQRGLLYVDPRAGAVLPPGITGRGVDLLIDETPGAREIDANLSRLETVARERGSALGLISVPRPVALARLVAWTSGLKDRGIALVPVSAVVHAPPRAERAGP